jgi:RNA polymerase sigma factor (sigma-70 family)
MEEALPMPRDVNEQDRSLIEAFEKERRRLRAFIRRRIPDELDPEDLLQDVFFELLEAYRLMKPIAHAGAWMMQVARNRITDLFRRKRPESAEDGGQLILKDLLPSPNAGPDALYARSVLMREIEAALAELPPSQRDVFIGHEIEGRSFADMAETGVSVNTLLSRKHYAVRHLRSRLRDIYDELSS